MHPNKDTIVKEWVPQDVLSGGLYSCNLIFSVYRK